MIYDPIRHRYFQVSREAIELLERWQPERADAFAERCAAELGRAVTVADVGSLIAFLTANHLVLSPPRDEAREFARQKANSKQAMIWRLIHSYLFFKVPLLRPAKFFEATLPVVAPLFSRTAAVVLLLIWIAGLYFALRQWDQFVVTFMDFMNFEGAIAFGATLVVVKALHELGHAYTATRAGVRVNTMGVAFMVMTPILYTDVTDAWRLRDSRDKLAIDIAGVAVEFGLAGIALLGWAFLPEGALRSVAFVTTTTSLITGLAINLNPLMRFDGYHLLADALQVPNLQSRSNDMATWWLRELLFSLGHRPPEAFVSKKRRLLVAYAFACWIYRFFLFLGIALVVYHMFFKALGVVLFAIEIIWFIALPVAREMMKWWKMRDGILKQRRWLAPAAITLLAIAAIVVPWSGTIRVQGVVMAEMESIIYAPRPARVLTIDVVNGQHVAVGQKLLTLSVTDLDHELRQTLKKIELIRHRLDRIAGDEIDRSSAIVLQGELVRQTEDLKGQSEEKARLVVRARNDGIIRDLDRDIEPGEWVSDTVPIGRVVGNTVAIARGYVSEDDIWRIDEGSKIKFIPEDPIGERRTGRLVELEHVGIRVVDLPYLASVYGGAVMSDRVDHEIRPRSGRHAVRIALDGAAVDRVVRGTLHLEAKPESIAAAMWRRILQVLVRESSA